MKRKILFLACAAVLMVAMVVAAVAVDRADYEQLTGWQGGLYAIMNREEIINTRYTGQVSEEMWTPENEYRLEDTVILEKESGKDFVVMNISDLHMTDYSTYEELRAFRDMRTLSFIGMMARQIRPDLITISGDIFAEDSGSVIFAVRRLSEYLDKLGIPWAPIFDNHDDNANCDDNYIADIMMQYESCLLQKGDAAMGVGNYIINICQDGKPLHSIVMMDSHGGNVWDNQMQWYRWAVDGASQLADGKLVSTVITHVPLAQYVYAYEEAWDSENDCWRDEYEAFGKQREEPCCELDENGLPVDNGFFGLMQELGSTANVICGHDHVNNYSILYRGIRLTYSQRVAVGSSETTGATILTISEDGSAGVKHYYMYTDGD